MTTTVTTREEFEQRRIALADHLIEHPGDFLMTCFGYRSEVAWKSRSGANVECGTVGCIAGTAIFLAQDAGLMQAVWSEVRSGNWMLDHVNVDGELTDIATAAADYLGMNPRTGLFYDFSITNAEEAAKRLLEEPYIED